MSKRTFFHRALGSIFFLAAAEVWAAGISALAANADKTFWPTFLDGQWVVGGLIAFIALVVFGVLFSTRR